MRDCLKALGWIYDHTESSHESWVHEQTRQVAIIDTKWDPVGGNMVCHFVRQELHLTREAFYGATKSSRKKIGLR
jgi:predicted RNA binding protein YcfA (HicA-like mRNA interferase family)